MTPREQLEIRKPLRDVEAKVVRLAMKNSEAWPQYDLDRIRYAISFARMTIVRNSDDQDVEVADILSRHRWWVTHNLRQRIEGDSPTRDLHQFIPELSEQTILMRDKLLSATSLDRKAVDEEACHRQLVVVSGGGGGGGYGYSGAFISLHRNGLQPKLLSGTSIGALISMFRARHEILDQLPMIEAVKRLKWNTVFRVFESENRYGVPATLRLYLRSAIGNMFNMPDESSMRFADCQIPLLIVTTGLTVNSFKHDLSYYEHFMDDAVRTGFRFRLSRLRKMAKLLSVIQEFVSNPETMREVVFGADEITLQADVLDAAGFSAAIPGLIHYDVLREDPRMVKLLDQLYSEYGITRLGEGGLVNNVPAKPAFEEVMRGRIKRRNPFVLAMDCFSPQPSSLIWYPIQQLVQRNVRQNLPYVDLYFALQKRLPAVNVVPSVPQITRAIDWTISELECHMPFIVQMCRSHSTI